MTNEDRLTGLDARVADGDSDYPPPDDLFTALASSTRRQLLVALPEQSAMTLDELTDILVGWQSVADGPAGPDEWAKVEIELVHAHLPLLADAGLVTYDDEEVRRASYPAAVDELIAFASEYEEVTVGDEPRR